MASGPSSIDVAVVQPDGSAVSGFNETEGGPAMVFVPSAGAGDDTVRVLTGDKASVESGEYTARATLAATDPDPPPPPPDPGEGPTIALLDTGINAGHQEFAPGQLVGWWDFTRHLPTAGDVFDTSFAPADPEGHGTLTAANAAGLNVAPEKTPSFAPGYRLAMGKVYDDSAGLNADLLPAGIRWAVDTVAADVINISIGSDLPMPMASALRKAVYDALAYARSEGVLVTVSNGNLPGDGASHHHSSSPDVLAVGATAGADSTYASNPEVVANHVVTGPGRACDDCYAPFTGTSFSAPLTAGFAGRLLREARDAGQDLPVDRLEQLIKYTAFDSELPPTHEGYGIVDERALPVAIAHARAGTRPARPDPDLNARYVEDVTGTERQVQDTEPTDLSDLAIDETQRILGLAGDALEDPSGLITAAGELLDQTYWQVMDRVPRPPEPLGTMTHGPPEE